MSDVLLNIEALSVLYGDFIAVEEASLSVDRGEIVSLIGLNGAGKTTLMSAVMGLLQPSSGKVIFDGQDITAMHTDKIVGKGLSLIPQGGRCFRLSLIGTRRYFTFPRREDALIRFPSSVARLHTNP